MGLADVLGAEERVKVKFSDFYKLMRESVKAELMLNGIKCRVPYEHIETIMTGEFPEKTGEMEPEEVELSTGCIKPDDEPYDTLEPVGDEHLAMEHE